VFPVLGIVISVGLLIHLVTQQNRHAFLIAAGILALGAAL